ncbi:LANO_0H22892g1_1 [Lachancea nothofagi CBS 11611]|uniref:non-specific serine/threonine protein kinase n=1 Tax=Lachancea nothofagi CBS 11611 TaxID=1266666 RepID=A0A1G4KNP1_9SACH|nr:LANO_0H22892g1_1 [Lachancea nothofagi CBS 11611]
MYGNKPANGQAKTSVNQLFKRTEVIGRGKFGVVYKGYYMKTRQVCAIKVLNLDSADDEVEDVQKEIQFLSSLKQVPNITHYYGSYLNDTKLWVIMEHCAGGSLRTLLRPGKIGEQYIGVIMRELLTALLHIHRDGVIHRDIKAANVLITNDGHVKLCDFGVAAQLSQTKIRRQTMAGTPYWMAPEVIMEGVYYDTKVDIWSLGITIYEIATGNPPYCEVEALRAMQLITKSKPPRLEGRQYSSALKEIIALCLDEDPKERPSAEELLKTKFIKLHKNLPVSSLKEVVSRYLLYRDQQAQREAAPTTLDDEDPNKTDSVDLTNDGRELEIKWDFDSLSSKEYILENDINIDAITEESSPSEHFNYSYPDDDLFYHSNKKHYLNTTMGKGSSNVTTNNYTLQATNNNNSTTYQNTNTNYQSKQSKQSWANTSKKSETKASKALLQLFEDNEDAATDADYSRTVPTMPNKSQDEAARISTPLGDRNPHTDAFKNPVYHSQSTPALPMLQTNFSQPVIMGPQSSTALPTPIEIEIPEELPSRQEGSLTKPRSSTVSVPNNKPASLLQRRPTVTGGGVGRNDSSAVAMKVMHEDKQRHLTPASTSNVNKSSTRSVSPLKMPNGSPDKSNPVTPSNSSIPLAMKPVINDKSEILLKPLNGDDNNSGRTRINRDFKRQNPNLILQMPSPTSIVPNSLLDNSNTLTSNPEDANINQFGFNTSSTLPVAMTPVVEKHIDQLKRKVSTSTSASASSRNNSISQDIGSVSQSSVAVGSNSINSTPPNMNNGTSTHANPSAPNVAPTSSTGSATITASTVPVMEKPPKYLQMDMFIDYPDDSVTADDGSEHNHDRKFLVLRELDSLLKTVEDGFPAMEYALKEALSKNDGP